MMRGEEKKEARAGLARELGLLEAASVAVGTIIGTGIFIVPNKIAAEVEAAGLVFLVWIVAGALALIGALAFAELGAALPRAGGEYVYLKESYGPLWGFLYGWTYFLAAKTGSIAALATAFAIYLGYFFDLSAVFYTARLDLFGLDYTLKLGATQAVAIGMILLLSAINVLGVKVGGRVQGFSTVLKVLIIALLALLGLAMGRGSADHFLPLFPESRRAGFLSSFGLAMVSALWAYDGWNNLNMVAGEVRDPKRNIPRALILGTLLVAAIYLLANVSYIYLLPLDRIKSSERVAADAARSFLGPAGGSFFALAVLLSTFAALNGSILSGARIFYAMADDGLFFKRVARVHPRYHTPALSIMAQAGWACLLTLLGTYDQLYTYVIFSEWIFYGMVVAGVLLLRRKLPDLERPYRMHGYPWTAIIFVLLAAAFTANILISDPRDSVVGLILILLGLPAYLYWRRGSLGAGRAS